MKKCTWCGQDYEDSATVCATDMQPLEAVAQKPIPHQTESSGAGGTLVAQESLLFPRQVGRMSFVVRYALLVVAFWLAWCLLSVGTGMQPALPRIALLALSVVVSLFALFYLIRHVVVARTRDIGIHDSFSLLTFVPVVNIVFLLALAFAPKGAFMKRSPTG
jgi:hypothetical protein